MDEAVKEKIQLVLLGKVKYRSSNLAFNMLISKMQKKLKTDPSSMDSCMSEMDEFLGKYPIVAKVDLANIETLKK